MSKPYEPKKVKLVIGFFGVDKETLDKIELLLVKCFGKIDYKTHDLNFSETNYYEAEMGENLLRRFISFEKLIDRSKLPDVKLKTNKIETKFIKKNTVNCSRTVNIDPGILSFENFVLASGKGFTHRIYLGKKIWGDLTLIYQKNRFQSLPWTYIDYKSEYLQTELLKIRKIYHEQIKKEG